MINEKRLISRFIDYVRVDSESGYERNFAKVLMNELHDLGLEVYMDDAGKEANSNSGNIIAKLYGNQQKETLLFSSHMDTVKPGSGIEPHILSDRICTDGTTILGADDKAGIASIIEAIRTVKEKGFEHGDVEIVFTVNEEVGLQGVKNLKFEELAAKKAFVLDSDAQPGEIIVTGPAQDNIEIKIMGKAAHAGLKPEQGISSIMVAAEAISTMNLLRIDEDTTANIGIIAGGEATNIVCPEAFIKGEARSLSEEKLNDQVSHMVKCFVDAARKFGAEIDIQTERVYPAFNIKHSEDIIKIACKAAESIGLNPVLKSSGGGSDTNIFNSYGLRAVNLGVGMKNPHSLDEFIEIKDLKNTSELVCEIIRLV